MNNIDKIKPELKPGERLCDGCWKVSKNISDWLYMNFKHLDPTLLCAECAEKYGQEFQKLQEHNL